MKVMIMGYYILIYSTFGHALPWSSSKSKSQPSTTEKYKSTRYSKLLAVTYEDSSGDDTTTMKSERRSYESSGFREPKSCEACNAEPWIPVVKFSQRAPKNIIYQEEAYHEGGNDGGYIGPKTYLSPPLSQYNTQPPHNYQQYSDPNPISNAYQRDSIPQHSENIPKLTPCDLLKHNHDSLVSGSETFNSIENHQDHLMNHLNGYKKPNFNSDFFRYFSFIKHPDGDSKQNLGSNFTNDPHGNYQHENQNYAVPNVPTRQINQRYPKRGKDLFSYIPNSKPANSVQYPNKGPGHFEHTGSFPGRDVEHYNSYQPVHKTLQNINQGNHINIQGQQNNNIGGSQGNDFRIHEQPFKNKEINFNIQEQPFKTNTNHGNNFHSQEQPFQKLVEHGNKFNIQEQQFNYNVETYHSPQIAPYTAQEDTLVHYPAQFETESKTNQIDQIPYTTQQNYQHHVNVPHKYPSTDFESDDTPMQYLTPPRIQTGHRDGRLQHYNLDDDIENIGHHQVTENSQIIQLDIDNQEITVPETGDSVDDRATQLQSLSHIQLDQTDFQYDQNKLKKLSAIEWQCFLMNFIKYLKMSKAGHVVRMSHECDPITLHHFMTNLNTNDQMQTNTEILTNEIDNEEKEYTKLSLDNQNFIDNQNEIIQQVLDQQNDVTNIVSEQQELVKLPPHENEITNLVTEKQELVKLTPQKNDIANLVTEQHELVKLAPHLSGEYFVNSEFVKNYSQIAQEAVNQFIRQNEIGGGMNNEHDPPILMDFNNIHDQGNKHNMAGEGQENLNDTNKIKSFDQNKHVKNTGDTSNNTPKSNETQNSNDFNSSTSLINWEYIKTEHYLNNQEIIDNNNIFQDMLEAYTESTIPSEDSYTIGPIPYESESFTKNAAKSTAEANNMEISAPPNAMFYPKGFSFTNDQLSDFVTEKPILLTAPKKIKIVIPYRKRSSADLRKEKDDDDFQNSIDTWTADGYSNHKLSYNKFNQTSFNGLQKSKSIPLVYLNSTQTNSTGSEQSNISGNISKTWEDLTVAISPYTKERVYVVTPKSN